MSRLLKPSLCLILSGCFFGKVALAAPPDAGSLLNEQRRPGATLPDRLPAPQRDAGAERPSPADAGVRVTIAEFRFSGGEGLVTEAELQGLVKAQIGKSLSFAELQALVSDITIYLRDKKGYLLARAYLPRQDVTSGVIEIVIQVGKVDGKMKIDLKQPSRIDASVLQGIADSAVAEGAAVRGDEIERAVLLMSDLPGIKAKVALERGDTPGAARIVVYAEEGKLVESQVSVDNFGDRYTGTARGTAQLVFNDPLGRGEQFSLSYTGAEHMNQGRLGFQVPVTSTGLVANFSWTGMNYRLGGDFSSLNAKGKSSTFGGGLSYPLLRSRNDSIWLSMNGEVIDLEDESGGVQIRDRQLKLITAGISGSFLDGLGGGGMTSANLSLTAGDLDLSGLAANAAADAAGPRTAGNFMRGTYALARLQKLTGQLSLLASLRGQLADGNLDSSQKFILGGSSGVRAYPVGEASGDQGNLLTLEGRYDLTPTAQLVGFIDGGCIQLHKRVWGGAISNISGKNRYCLSGAGLAINIGQAGSYKISASLARALGRNPGRSLSGQNSDNRSDRTRLWLQAAFWF